jgi:hypothetical protein
MGTMVSPTLQIHHRSPALAVHCSALGPQLAASPVRGHFEFDSMIAGSELPATEAAAFSRNGFIGAMGCCDCVVNFFECLRKCEAIDRCGEADQVVIAAQETGLVIAKCRCQRVHHDQGHPSPVSPAQPKLPNPLTIALLDSFHPRPGCRAQHRNLPASHRAVPACPYRQKSVV